MVGGDDIPRVKRWQYRRVLTEHVFDKLWSLDLMLGEFRALLDTSAEIIEETATGWDDRTELLLFVEWRDPLHVVVVVDDLHEEERIITAYRPDPDRWSADYRSRNR